MQIGHVPLASQEREMNEKGLLYILWSNWTLLPSLSSLAGKHHCQSRSREIVTGAVDMPYSSCCQLTIRLLLSRRLWILVLPRASWMTPWPVASPYHSTNYQCPQWTPLGHRGGGFEYTARIALHWHSPRIHPVLLQQLAYQPPHAGNFRAASASRVPPHCLPIGIATEPLTSFQALLLQKVIWTLFPPPREKS